MIQHSQGFIVDRTREHLTATDSAVVRFRRKIIEAARQLDQGNEPTAHYNSGQFCTRPGSWFAKDDVPFEDVMLERFGHPLGRVRQDRFA